MNVPDGWVFEPYNGIFRGKNSDGNLISCTELINGKPEGIAMISHRYFKDNVVYRNGRPSLLQRVVGSKSTIVSFNEIGSADFAKIISSKESYIGEVGNNLSPCGFGVKTTKDFTKQQTIIAERDKNSLIQGIAKVEPCFDKPSYLSYYVNDVQENVFPLLFKKLEESALFEHQPKCANENLVKERDHLTNRIRAFELWISSYHSLHENMEREEKVAFSKIMLSYGQPLKKINDYVAMLINETKSLIMENAKNIEDYNFVENLYIRNTDKKKNLITITSHEMMEKCDEHASWFDGITSLRFLDMNYSSKNNKKVEMSAFGEVGCLSKIEALIFENCEVVFDEKGLSKEHNQIKSIVFKDTFVTMYENITADEEERYSLSNDFAKFKKITKTIFNESSPDKELDFEEI